MHTPKEKRKRLIILGTVIATLFLGLSITYLFIQASQSKNQQQNSSEQDKGGGISALKNTADTSQTGGSVIQANQSSGSVASGPALPTVERPVDPTFGPETEVTGKLPYSMIIVEKLKEEGVYKSLYETKGWESVLYPTDTQWFFKDKEGKKITISYRGKPYPGGNAAVSVNQVHITDTSSCIERGNNEFKKTDDSKMTVVESLCKKYYFGISVNGNEVENPQKSILDAIWISKKSDEIALYSGMLVVNYNTGEFKLQKPEEIQLGDFILLTHVR